MVETEFDKVLKAVQISKASHQKNVRILQQYYQKVSEQEFVNNFFKYMRITFSKISVPVRNEYVERALDFLALFVSAVTPAEDDTVESFEDDSGPNFLTKVITETLKYHNLSYESIRYNSCLFVRLILQHIGQQTHLDNEICDIIQEAMLERTLDPRPSIRLQAVMALARLQDPFNPDCPVIKSYLSLIVDGNAQIRAEVVRTIAPDTATIPHIINRLTDVDCNVRIMAFRRCADLGPKHFKIIERQHILKCGLSTNQQKIKKVFTDNLLVKWLNAYDGNYVLFLNALKLDADETDIGNTEKISKDVMNLLFSTIPVNNISALLNLDKDKSIPFDTLTTESVMLWNIAANYVRNFDDEEYLEEDILPELTPFCNYIERYIAKKKTENMKEWEYLDYQCILFNLFEMAEQHDLSDEVGRKMLYQLVTSVLKEEDLQFRVTNKVVCLAYQLTPKTDDFTSIICHIMSDIREPLIEKPLTVNPVEHSNQEYQKASLKVKLNVLTSELEDATDNQEFLKADGLKKQIDILKEKLKEVSVSAPTFEMVKVSKDDPKTICRCLDLLIALLQLPNVSTFSPSLVAVKEEFIVPLLKSNVGEVNWRVLNCLALFCVIEGSLVEEYIKIICIPIITYRAIPNLNKMALMVSVKAVSDLFRLYGSAIFGQIEDTASSNNHMNGTRRRLYRGEDAEESILDPNRFHLESIIEIILDMLDDENPEIRNNSVRAISKLIFGNFQVTPLFITRLMLKWYSPLTGVADACTSTRPTRNLNNGKSSDNLQQLLGVLIGNYANTVKGAREIICKAVVPILTSIASAPNTSPLADVDVDNLLHFLAVITNSDDKMDVVNMHLNLAQSLCYEIVKKKNASIVHHLVKLLLYLEVPSENPAVIKELICLAKIPLGEENVLDKGPRKYMLKFLEKLRDSLESQDETNVELTNVESVNVGNASQPTVDQQCNSTSTQSENEIIESCGSVDDSEQVGQNVLPEEGTGINVCKKQLVDNNIESTSESSVSVTESSNDISDMQGTENDDNIKGIDSNNGNLTTNIHKNTKDKEEQNTQTGKKTGAQVTNNNLIKNSIETTLKRKRKGKEKNILKKRSNIRINGNITKSDATTDTEEENVQIDKRLKISGIDTAQNLPGRLHVGENDNSETGLNENKSMSEKNVGKATEKPAHRVKHLESCKSKNIIDKIRIQEKIIQNADESECMMDNETNIRRKSKRLRVNLKRLEIAEINNHLGSANVNGITNQNRSQLAENKNALSSSPTVIVEKTNLSRSSSDTTFGNHENETSKRRNKNNGSRISSSVDSSSEDTTLHTILQELSQMSRLNDSIQSKNSSSSSKYLRSANVSRMSNSSNDSPILGRSARKIRKLTSESSLESQTGSHVRRSARKIRKKT